jgi:hypothetical protein
MDQMDQMGRKERRDLIGWLAGALGERPDVVQVSYDPGRPEAGVSVVHTDGSTMRVGDVSGSMLGECTLCGEEVYAAGEYGFQATSLKHGICPRDYEGSGEIGEPEPLDYEGEEGEEDGDEDGIEYLDEDEVDPDEPEYDG